MNTGLHSVNSIREHLLKSIKPKGEICLIFYLIEDKNSGFDENGFCQVDYVLRRKAIPAYLYGEFLSKYGMGIRISEKDVLSFIDEHKINISDDQIDDFIIKNY